MASLLLRHVAGLLCLVLWLLLSPLAAAPAKTGGKAGAAGGPPPPRLGYVYPAGGCVGTTFTVLLGGQHLDKAEQVLVTGPGVSVRIVDHYRPLTQKEFRLARERADELREKAGLPKEVKPASERAAEALATLSEAERSELLKLRSVLMEGNPRRVPNPALAETLQLEVSIAADAPEGTRELRVRSPDGVGNPLVFRIGRLREELVHPIELKPAYAQGRPLEPDQQRAVPRAELSVKLPATVNGRILQGGVDRIRFSATKGSSLVCAVEARALIPYLADAVPGWFQATLTLYDAKGRELAYNDDFRFSPDPVIHFVVPADGEYYLELKDSIFRGRDDFVYRLTLGELPFVTGLWPAGGSVGKPTEVNLAGWNLPLTRALMPTTGHVAGVRRFALAGIDEASAPVPFELSSDPEFVETDANEDPARATAVTLPCVVNGRISTAEDRDWFRFEGKAGQELVAEVMARRLASPLDSQLRLVDSQGRQIAFNDDHEDKSAALITHHADSFLQARLPADGTYFIELIDVQHQGGEALVYRLHLHEPRPDFELRTATSSLNIREGRTATLTVHALRREGFSGPIKVEAADPKSALRIVDGVIPAGADKADLTVSVRMAAQPEPYVVRLVGTATLGDGRTLRHEVIAADDMMQAFAYRHLVEARMLLLQVLPAPPQRVPQVMPRKARQLIP